MSSPVFQIYTKRSTGEQMNSDNLALSTEEQNNLIQNHSSFDGDQAPGRSSQVKLYSLQDLFSISQEELDQNVYQMIIEVQSQNQ